jgi:hypothetical protein
MGRLIRQSDYSFMSHLCNSLITEEEISFNIIFTNNVDERINLNSYKFEAQMISIHIERAIFAVKFFLDVKIALNYIAKSSEHLPPMTFKS